MTKEEKIQEAYGEHWGLFKNYLEKIKTGNGWALKSLIPFLNIEEIEFFEALNRPKSLQGIENNNGWNNIKEKGLPECEKTVIWLRDEGEPPVISSILDEDFYGAAYFTHWTEFPLKPPIY